MTNTLMIFVAVMIDLETSVGTCYYFLFLKGSKRDVLRPITCVPACFMNPFVKSTPHWYCCLIKLMVMKKVLVQQ